MPVHPAARWYFLLVHAAAVSDTSIIYDVLVEAVGSKDESGRPRRDAAAYGDEAAADDDERRATLAERWRYWVDPEGPSTQHEEWVVARYLDPDS